MYFIFIYVNLVLNDMSHILSPNLLSIFRLFLSLILSPYTASYSLAVRHQPKVHELLPCLEATDVAILHNSDQVIDTAFECRHQQVADDFFLATSLAKGSLVEVVVWIEGDIRRD
jgi:hypothetical protein